MFDFLKRKKSTETNSSLESEPSKTGLLDKLKQGLAKTRAGFADRIGTLFLGKKELNADLVNEVETILLTSDIGINTTEQLIQLLTQKLARKELSNTDAVLNLLKQELKNILTPSTVPLIIPKQNKPFVILMVGINGSGKTTTIGKLAYQFREAGHSIMLAAGDTFRAAAIEQLKRWGERNQVPVIAQDPNADTAAVIYDALAAAQARHIDILLADTAGRLHTQSNLMAELQKVKRVLAKLDPDAPQETLIVLDASIGQNALNQVKQFHSALGITGIVLTKLDGTAKGGIIFAIAKETGLPIRYIGVGEGIQDLRVFSADEFVDALFAIPSA